MNKANEYEVGLQKIVHFSYQYWLSFNINVPGTQVKLDLFSHSGVSTAAKLE